MGVSRSTLFETASNTVTCQAGRLCEPSAKQSRSREMGSGLLRCFAPRNDESMFMAAGIRRLLMADVCNCHSCDGSRGIEIYRGRFGRLAEDPLRPQISARNRRTRLENDRSLSLNAVAKHAKVREQVGRFGASKPVCEVASGALRRPEILPISLRFGLRPGVRRAPIFPKWTKAWRSWDAIPRPRGEGLRACLLLRAIIVLPTFDLRCESAD